MILLQSGDKYLREIASYIAIDRKIEQNKTRYYTVLHQCSDGRFTVLECFKSNPEIKLKVADIEKTTALPRRTIQFALKSLAEKTFLNRLGKGAGSRYQLVF